MASSPTLDVESILIPITGENPSGVDVRYTRYDIIKEARREDENLSQGEWKPKRPPKMADWGKVIEMASTTLTLESKDLQVCAWLLEGLVKRHGFAGLRDGLVVFRELYDRFWDSVYPMIEDGDKEYRAAPVEWLNEKDKAPFFPFSIKTIPILHGSDGRVYSYSHWEESRTVDNLGRQNTKAKAEAMAEGKISKEEFEKAETSTPLTHCLALLEDITQCSEEVLALDEVMKKKFGEDSRDRPSLENVREAVKSCLSYVQDLVKKKGGAGMNDASSHAPQELPVSNAALDPTPPMPQASGGIDPTDRLDALRRLAAVAEFFRRTEPHSPVAYIVQRATRWGEMPLEEWLHEVIKSKDVLGHVRETLGLKDEKPQS